MACQGSQDRAKPDTVFYAVGDWDDYASLAVDLSQTGKDLSDNTTYASLGAGDEAHLRLSNNRTVEVYFRVGSGDGTGDGTLVTHGDQYRLFVSHDDGELRVVLDNTVAQRVALPSWSSAVDEYLVCWGTEPNPYANGSGDALRSEIVVWNVSQGTCNKSSWTHAVNGTNAANFYVGANAGSDNFAGEIRMVRISDRFHPPTEAWVQLAEVSIDQDTIFHPDLQTLVDPISGATGTADGTTYDETTAARDFDGATDHLAWSGLPDMTGVPITVSAWIHIDSYTNGLARYFEISQGTPGVGGGLFAQLTASNDRLTVAHQHADTSCIKTFAAPATTWVGRWAHIVFTYDGTGTHAGIKAYYDGTEQTTTISTIDGAGTPRNLNGSWSIGGVTYADTANVDGKIRDVRVFDRVLSEEEVARLYRMGPNPFRDQSFAIKEETRIEHPVPGKSERPDADDGAFAGPVFAQVAADTRQMDLLLGSPLVNWADEDGPLLDTTYMEETKPAWQIGAPDNIDYKMWLSHFCWRPVSPAFNALKVRATIRVDSGTGNKTLHVRCYSLNGIPGQLGGLTLDPDDPPFDYRFVGETVVGNHGMLEREIVEFSSFLPIVRDAEDGTYLALAFYAEDTTIDWQVQGWTVEPVLVDSDDLGLPGVGGFAG